MIQEVYKKLQESPEFKEWKKLNPNSFLAHAFVMLEHNNVSEWQFGYYLPDKDRIVTFFMMKEVKASPESKIFKDKNEIKELDMKLVKIDFMDALKKAKTLQEKKYSSQSPINIVAILQKIKVNSKWSQVWNITFVTKSFNTLNIKVDSGNGKILSHRLTSIFDFRATT